MASSSPATADEDDDDDASRRIEEFEAITSFYGDDVLEVASTSASHGVIVEEGESASPSQGGPWRIRVGPKVVLEIHLPIDYPSASAPVPLLCAPPWIMDECQASDLVTEMIEMYEPDMEVAILWAEHMRAALSTNHEDDVNGAAAEDASNDEIGSANENEPKEEDGVRTFFPPTSKYGQPIRHFNAADILSDANQCSIHHGQPFHPPRSGPSETMIAHVAQITSMAQVNWVLAELLFNDKRVARATHNMIAYRFWDGERGCMVSDNDDDGEKGSGTKLAALLDLADVNDVIVVVSRWFGGVHLGPSRFKHIANTARDALKDAGFIHSPSSAVVARDGGKRKGRNKS